MPILHIFNNVNKLNIYNGGDNMENIFIELFKLYIYSVEINGRRKKFRSSVEINVEFLKQEVFDKNKKKIINKLLDEINNYKAKNPKRIMLNHIIDELSKLQINDNNLFYYIAKLKVLDVKSRLSNNEFIEFEKLSKEPMSNRDIDSLSEILFSIENKIINKSANRNEYPGEFMTIYEHSKQLRQIKYNDKTNDNEDRFKLIYDELLREFVVNGKVKIYENIYENLRVMDKRGKYCFLIAKNIPDVNMGLLEDIIISNNDYLYNFIIEVNNCNRRKLIKAFLELNPSFEAIMSMIKVVKDYKFSDLFTNYLILKEDSKINDLFDFAMNYDKEIEPITRYFYLNLNKDNLMIQIEYLNKINVSEKNVFEFEKRLLNMVDSSSDKNNLYNYIYYSSKFNDVDLIVNKVFTDIEKEQVLRVISVLYKIDFNKLSEQTINLIEDLINKFKYEITSKSSLFINLFSKIAVHMKNIDIENLISNFLYTNKKLRDNQQNLMYIYYALKDKNISQWDNIKRAILIDMDLGTIKSLISAEEQIDKSRIDVTMINLLLDKMEEDNIRDWYDCINYLECLSDYREAFEKKIINFDHSGLYLAKYAFENNSIYFDKIIEKIIYSKNYRELTRLMQRFPDKFNINIELEIIKNMDFKFKQVLAFYNKNIFKHDREKCLGSLIDTLEELMVYIEQFGFDNEIANSYIKTAIYKCKLNTSNAYRKNFLRISELSKENQKKLIYLTNNPVYFSEYLLVNNIEENKDFFNKLLEIDNSGKDIVKLIAKPEVNENIIVESLIDKDKQYFLKALGSKNVIIPNKIVDKYSASDIYSLIVDNNYNHLKNQLEYFLIEKDISGYYLRELIEKKLAINEKLVYNAIISKKTIKSKIFRLRYKKEYERDYEEVGHRDLDIDLVNELISSNDKLLAIYKRIDLKIERLINLGHNSELLEKVKKAIIEGIISKKGAINDTENSEAIYGLLETAHDYINSLEKQFFYKHKYINNELNKSEVNEIEIMKKSFNIMSDETKKFTETLK